MRDRCLILEQKTSGPLPWGAHEYRVWIQLGESGFEQDATTDKSPPTDGDLVDFLPAPVGSSHPVEVSKHHEQAYRLMIDQPAAVEECEPPGERGSTDADDLAAFYSIAEQVAREIVAERDAIEDGVSAMRAIEYELDLSVVGSAVILQHIGAHYLRVLADDLDPSVSFGGTLKIEHRLSGVERWIETDDQLRIGSAIWSNGFLSLDPIDVRGFDESRVVVSTAGASSKRVNVVMRAGK